MRRPRPTSHPLALIALCVALTAFLLGMGWESIANSAPLNAQSEKATPSKTPKRKRKKTRTPTPTRKRKKTRTPTRTATFAATFTPVAQTLILQNGSSPDAAYDGATDASITTWGGNTYANLGGMEYVQFGEDAAQDSFRALLRFELANLLPTGAQVDDATLELYAYDAGYDDAARDVVAHTASRDWLEGDGWDLSADARNQGVTWSTARPNVAWTNPGGDFDAAELDRVTIPANPNGWYRWNVTSAVASWLNSWTPNYGFLLEPDNGAWLHHQFRSSEYRDASLRPRLVIHYHVGGPAPTFTPTRSPQTATPTSTATFAVTFTPTRTPTSTATFAVTFTPTPPRTPTTPPAPVALNVALTVRENNGVARVNDPVTQGVPLPFNAYVYNASTLVLSNASQQAVPAQFTVLARWGGAPDDASKPIKWVLVDFQANVAANGSAIYQLKTGTPPALSGIQTTDSATTLEVNTGAARFSLNKNAFTLFDQIYRDRDNDGAVDDALLAAPGSIAGHANGVAYTADATAPQEIALEQSGALHTVVRVKGHLRGNGANLLAYTARLHFYANQPTARVMFTVWNDNLMVNSNGQPYIKEFGSPNTVVFDDLSLQLQLAGANPNYILAGANNETWSGALTTNAELYQESSGGPQWNHAPDNVSNSFRGFRALANGSTLHAACDDAADENGCRSQGWGGAQTSTGSVVAGVRYFWQNYPKAVNVDANGAVSVGVFPAQYPASFELRVGEQKTHEVVFYFGANNASNALRALQNPLHAWASADYYLTQAQAFDRAIPRDPTDFADFEGYVDATILYPSFNLFILRDGAVNSGWLYAPRPEAWGWRNFGDTIAEDETGGGSYPVFTNQQYDHPWAALFQMVRALNGSDSRADLWWQIAESGAWHQADVDVIHSLCTGQAPEEMLACMDTVQGPPYPVGWAMGGRLTNQWHADPSVNLHRHALIDYWSGGLRGLLYYYYFTGDGVIKDAWMELAENARWRVEHSPCNPDCGPGYANNNPGEGDARGPAYALEILTDAYGATGDAAYLDAARLVIDRSHPDQTWFGAPNYAPNPNVAPSGKQTSPWALSMIMKSLGRFLDVQTEWQGSVDDRARDSLVTYATLLAKWWRLGDAQPTCYRIGENGGCSAETWDYMLPDGLAWALAYDDGRADRTRWQAVGAEAWQKGVSDPWNGYAKNTFTSSKTQIMIAINGSAWMRWAINGK
ncbi:MAG: DNRLRE domain-containing protein [Chloroflexi bacterium]|nr:DNRLRE domain-containing protein [Chloroflexota bacterium]